MKTDTTARISALQVIEKHVPFLQSPCTYLATGAEASLRNPTVAQSNIFQTSNKQKIGELLPLQHFSFLCELDVWKELRGAAVRFHSEVSGSLTSKTMQKWYYFSRHESWRYSRPLPSFRHKFEILPWREILGMTRTIQPAVSIAFIPPKIFV